jgi:hypothetical protein
MWEVTKIDVKMIIKLNISCILIMEVYSTSKSWCTLDVTYFLMLRPNIMFSVNLGFFFFNSHINI